MNTVVCSHPDKQMADDARGFTQTGLVDAGTMDEATSKTEAGMMDGAEILPEQHYPMPPAIPRSAVNSRNSAGTTDLAPLKVHRHGQGTSSAFTPGKSSDTPVEANDNKTKENGGGFMDSMKTTQETDAMHENKEVTQARELISEEMQLRNLHTKVLELLKIKHNLSPALDVVCKNPLRTHPHTNKAFPVIRILQLLDTRDATTVEINADNVFLEHKVLFGSFVVVSLMQGNATGTTQFKACITAWDNAKKKAMTLADDEQEIAGALLVGALKLFLAKAGMMYKAILMNNHAASMTKSTRENIIVWLNALTTEVGSYWPVFAAEYERNMLRKDFISMAQGTYAIQDNETKTEAADLADD